MDPISISSILDFGALATAVAPLIGAAVLAAATVGGGVYVAKLGWRTFKSFGKG